MQENVVNNYLSASDKAVVFKGNKYRITILSDVLIRLDIMKMVNLMTIKL